MGTLLRVAVLGILLVLSWIFTDVKVRNTSSTYLSHVSWTLPSVHGVAR